MRGLPLLSSNCSSGTRENILKNMRVLPSWPNNLSPRDLSKVCMIMLLLAVFCSNPKYLTIITRNTCTSFIRKFCFSRFPTRLWSSSSKDPSCIELSIPCRVNLTSDLLDVIGLSSSWVAAFLLFLCFDPYCSSPFFVWTLVTSKSEVPWVICFDFGFSAVLSRVLQFDLS